MHNFIKVINLTVKLALSKFPHLHLTWVSVVSVAVLSPVILFHVESLDINVIIDNTCCLSVCVFIRNGCPSQKEESSTPKPQKVAAPSWGVLWTPGKGSLRGREGARHVQVLLLDLQTALVVTRPTVYSSSLAHTYQRDWIRYNTLTISLRIVHDVQKYPAVKHLQCLH